MPTSRPVNDPRVSRIARDLAPELLKLQAERRSAETRIDARERKAVGACLLKEYGGRRRYGSRDPTKEVSLTSLAAALQQPGVDTSEGILQRQISAHIVELELGRAVSALKELSTTHLWMLSRVPDMKRRTQLARAAVTHGWSTRVLEAAINDEKSEKKPPRRSQKGGRWSAARIQERLKPVLSPLRRAFEGAPAKVRRVAVEKIADALGVEVG